jgi:hypothetical protein
MMFIAPAGADLQASAAAVGNSLPGGARGYLGYVTSHIGDPQVLPFIEAAVEARAELASSLPGGWRGRERAGGQGKGRTKWREM